MKYKAEYVGLIFFLNLIGLLLSDTDGTQAHGDMTANFIFSVYTTKIHCLLRMVADKY
jgi:hypothetical protein